MILLLLFFFFPPYVIWDLSSLTIKSQPPLQVISTYVLCDFKNTQYSKYRQQYSIIIKLVKRLELNYSSHTKEMIMRGDRGANHCYNGNYSISL